MTTMEGNELISHETLENLNVKEGGVAVMVLVR